MKGLTRPCADSAESKDVDVEGHRQVRIELALKLTLFLNNMPRWSNGRIAGFQSADEGSIPSRGAEKTSRGGADGSTPVLGTGGSGFDPQTRDSG